VRHAAHVVFASAALPATRRRAQRSASMTEPARMFAPVFVSSAPR
jgi:hypothetical protein